MKKLIYLLACILTLSLAVSVVVADQDDDIKKHPGYVDFSGINFPADAEETVEVTIRGPILKFVANITHDEDRSLSRVLAQLHLIRVNTCSVENSDLKKLRDEIRKMESKLKKEKWEKIVRVTKRDEHVNIFVKSSNSNHFDGLVIMAVDDDDEAVFVNIVGEVDWETLGKIGRKFEIEKLEDLDYD